MPSIKVLNQLGQEVKDLELSSEVFECAANNQVIADVINSQRAAMRQGTADTKTRTEVSGGGKKPYRQKGTGRARQGSIRATQWRGGGIAGGVTPRDYTFDINKKERALALKSALSHKFQDKKLVVVDAVEMKTLKTKEIKDIMATLKLKDKVLFVTGADNENLFMATRNLGYAYNVNADEINCYDIVNADTLVVDEAAVEVIEGGLK